MAPDKPRTTGNDDALTGEVLQCRLDGSRVLNSADHRTNLYGRAGALGQSPTLWPTGRRGAPWSLRLCQV